MTSYIRYQPRTRDIQDGTERHLYGEIEYDNTAGGIVKVRGTGTQDEEANLLRIGGAWVHPKKDADVEVFLLSGGSDTAQKHAIIDLPWDKYHKTKENTNGMQSMLDPANRVEFNEKRTHITEKNVAIGPNGEIELKDGKIYLRAPVEAESISSKTINTPALKSPPPASPGPVVIPNFEATS